MSDRWPALLLGLSALAWLLIGLFVIGILVYAAIRGCNA